MNKNYKVEWTEPTYGCCYMTKTDADTFNSALGTPQEIYTTRHDLLESYDNQKPFNGDGTLYYKTWDEYQKTLPVIIKINQAMTSEKIGRYNIAFGISQSTSLKNKIYGGFENLSSTYQNDPFSLFENKSSMKRKKEEGTKADNGNILKATSLLMTPAITDLAYAASDEANDATLKAESISDSLVNAAITSAKTGIKQSYSSLKTSITEIKTQATAFKTVIETLKENIPVAMASAITAGAEAAEEARTAIEEAKDELIENATTALAAAVAAIASSFATVASLVFEELPFTNFVVDATGENTESETVNGVIQNDCPKLDEETYPAEYESLSHRCFEPEKEDDETSKETARIQAEAFSSRYNGHVVWLDGHQRWCVFYDINAYLSSSDEDDGEEE